MDPMAPVSHDSPSIWRWFAGFLLVGVAWGLTTPFMRKAAVSREQKETPSPATDSSAPWIQRKLSGVFNAVYDLLKNPAYAIPLLLNVTGGVWFFLLIGQAELSLTVPITNSLSLLFTVLGEWWAEDTWIGMALVLGGIALCVHSKS